MEGDLNTGSGAQGDTNAGGTGGDSGTSWFDSLPEDVRGNEAAAAWKDKQPGDLLKAHMELDGKLKGALVRPGENATPEEQKAFDKALRAFVGAPETADGYEVVYPEGVTKEDPIVHALVAQAHKDGLNGPQLNSLLNGMYMSIQQFNEAQKAANAESVKTLWGAEYEANVARAIKAMEAAGAEAKLSPEEVAGLAKELPFFPAIVRIMAEVGRHYTEDNPPRGGSAGPKTGAVTKGGTPMLDFPSMEKK